MTRYCCSHQPQHPLSRDCDCDFHRPNLALATDRKQDINSIIASIYDDDFCHEGHTLWLRYSINAIDLEIRQNFIVVCVYTYPKDNLNCLMEISSNCSVEDITEKCIDIRKASDTPELSNDADRIYQVFSDFVSVSGVPVQRVNNKLLMGFAQDILCIEYDEINFEEVFRSVVAAADSLAGYLKVAGTWEDL